MPPPIPAVFISYASQDAEAAERIAEALRAAGVEVWFDKSELVGGDAWDKKIRDQIQSCTLFVPIISANTQARSEGYFRLEWKLAVDRSHLMADDTPFLFPIVLDDTPDAGARVPDRFRERQWMRLDATTPEAIATRITNVLSGESPSLQASPNSASPIRPTAAATASRDPAKRRSTSLIFGVITAAILVGVVAAFVSKQNSEPTTTIVSAEAAFQTAELESLLAQACDLVAQPDAGRLELEAAQRLCDRALELDETDPKVWTTRSKIELSYVAWELDDSPQRRASVRENAERAMQLDGSAYVSRFALADYLTFGLDALEKDRPRQIEIEEMARELLRERPEDSQARYILAFVLSKRSQTLDEAEEQYRRIAEDPHFASRAWMGIAWGRFWLGDYREAELAVQKSIKAGQTRENLIGAILIKLEWHGDLEASAEMIDQLSQRDLQTEDIGTLAAWVRLWRREPLIAIRHVDNLSREWISSGFFEGAATFLRGTARNMAGQHALAQRDFARALELTEAKLITEPDEAFVLGGRAELLHRLDRPEDAQRAYDIVREMNQTNVYFDVTLEPADLVIDRLESQFDSASRYVTAASLRHAYFYDPIRVHPRFQALLARAEASPKHTPNPKKVVLEAPAKSIAVLPFANRSANADDAYFTDGIHDDLLTHISRIRDIKTISRTSVMGYRATTKNLRTIGDELGVATILEGGVQRSGNQIRINVQLIDAATDAHLWAEIYTREMTAENVFAIQSEIATAITTALKAVLSPEEQKQLEKLPTQNLAALEAYFKGKSQVTGNTAEDYFASVAQLERAIALDPQFAAAYAALAQLHLAQIWGRGLPTDQQVAKARPYIDQALLLDPNSGEAHVALAAIRSSANDRVGAEAALRRALKLSPNNLEAHLQLANLMVWIPGRMEEALPLADQALELEPGNVRARSTKATALSNLGRYPSARALYQSLVDEGPDRAENWSSLGRLLHELQRQNDEAIKVLRTAHALDPNFPGDVRSLAWAHMELDMTEESLFWFNRALAISPEGQESALNRLFIAHLQEAPVEIRRIAETMLQESPKHWTSGIALNFLTIQQMSKGQFDQVLDVIESSAPRLANKQPVVDAENSQIAPRYAIALIRTGQTVRATPIIEQFFDYIAPLPASGRVGVATNLMQVELLVELDRREEAISAVRAFRDAGGLTDLSRFNQWGSIFYSALKTDPEFMTVQNEMLSELAKQRANVERMEANGELAPIPPLPEEAL